MGRMAVGERDREGQRSLQKSYAKERKKTFEEMRKV